MNSPTTPLSFEAEPSVNHFETPDDHESEAFDSREAGTLEGDLEFAEEFAGSDSDGRIIDLTAQADRSRRKGTRDPRKVFALVLHQMACCFNRREPLRNYLHTGAHFVILNDGRILQLHPITAYLWASNDFNPGSVAVEFAGNFPNTNGQWWNGATYGRNRPTQAQIEAGRYLVRHLIRTMGLRTILAHRQSSSTRENDPGPDIWYNVGQWAIENCGLTDGGPGFKVGTGNPIPDLWRNWGRVSHEGDFPQEFTEELDPEDSFYEAADESSLGEAPSTSQSQGPSNLAGPAGPFGVLTVRGRPSFRYAFTGEDAIWLARFVTGEAGGRDDSGSRAVIWAMFNRYAFFTHRVYPTFSRFLRAYSTPLQAVLNSGGAAARHYRNPDYVQTGGNYTGRYANIPRGQLGRFLRLQATPWRSLATSARGLAEWALRGQLPNPIGNASEFANTAVYYRQKYGQWPNMEQFRAYNISMGQQKRWTWIGDVQGLAQYRRNTFFVDNRVARLPQGAVVVTLPPGAQPEVGISIPQSSYEVDELHDEMGDTVANEMYGEREGEKGETDDMELSSQGQTCCKACGRQGEEETGVSWESEVPAGPYAKSLSGPNAECTSALTRAGKTQAQALAIINSQIGPAIRMLRAAANKLKRDNRTARTNAIFQRIFRVPPSFVPSWLKQTPAVKDRGDVVAVRCGRVADLLASGSIRYFCAINATNCPDCGGADPRSYACSSWGGVDPRRSNVICLGSSFWDDMKTGNRKSILSTLMHEPFHIYFGRYVTEHGHPSGRSVGKFGGINCIVQFVFEINGQTPPQRVSNRCGASAVRSAATGY